MFDAQAKSGRRAADLATEHIQEVATRRVRQNLMIVQGNFLLMRLRFGVAPMETKSSLYRIPGNIAHRSVRAVI